MAVWFRDEGAWFLDVPGFGVWCSVYVFVDGRFMAIWKFMRSVQMP